MPRPRKAWTKTVEESGLQVRVYERSPGSVLYREVRLSDGKDRKSLGHRDKRLAEEQARELARQIVQLRLAGHTRGPVTLGQLVSAYLTYRGPQLSARRRQFIQGATTLFLRHLGPGFVVDDFGQHHVDTYLTERRSGRLVPDDHRATESPRDGTLRNELQALSGICNWACGFKRHRERLLTYNPVRGIRQPLEQNPVRPRATQERYAKLLAVADEVDPSGGFRLMLVLAWHTGRRINAICHLRRSDVLLGGQETRRALAAVGEDEALADAWPDALRWAAEWDKGGYLTFSPMPAVVKEEVARYLRKHACVGDAWLFPSGRDRERPQTMLMAGYYLTRAEAAAGLPHLHRGGWHAFRRAWATARKSLPIQDVMQAGGWRDVKALQTAYQGADAETVRKVVDHGG